MLEECLWNVLRGMCSRTRVPFCGTFRRGSLLTPPCSLSVSIRVFSALLRGHCSYMVVFTNSFLTALVYSFPLQLDPGLSCPLKTTVLCKQLLSLSQLPSSLFQEHPTPATSAVRIVYYRENLSVAFYSLSKKKKNWTR